MVELTIEKAKTTIKDLYSHKSRDSILLLGNYGTGKTEGVAQCFMDIADSRGKTFIRYTDKILPTLKLNPDKYFVFVDFALTQCEPSDLTGIPRDEDGYIMYKPLGWAVALSICSGCLFLDELSNVQRLDVQSIMLKLLLEKLCGFTKLNDDVVVIAAGNKHGRLVSPLPEAVMAGRVIKLEIENPTLDEWTDYMNSNYPEFDKRVVVFLHKFGNLFAQDQNDDYEDWSVISTPRSWTKLANVSALISKKSLLPVSEGLVGRSAVEFQSFINTTTISADELSGDIRKWVRMTTDQKYFLSLELMNKSTEAMFTKYRNIMQMLASEDREFLSVTFMLMSKEKRKEALIKSRNICRDVFDMIVKCAVKSVEISGGLGNE
jgi:hypothetical protein